MLEPQNELGVIVAFVQTTGQSGFEIVRIGSQFPDATIRREELSYEIEFEFEASNFRNHGHDPRKCDLIVCWIDDGGCGPMPVLELSDPNWHMDPIILAEPIQKELLYWKWRAERAERSLAALEITLSSRDDGQDTGRRRLSRSEWRCFLANLGDEAADLTPDRVNELLTMHGYAPVPSSTARDWAADAPDRTEADGGS